MLNRHNLLGGGEALRPMQDAAIRRTRLRVDIQLQNCYGVNPP